jgi:hypothetical protein
MTNETLLDALEKDLHRKRMMRDVGVASAETRVNLQKNFIKELKMFSDVEILGIIPEMNTPTKENIIEKFNFILKNLS